ncbi:Transmembrane protein 41A-A [Taenia solium]|eukprot:TsM_001124900 transcript=TsM_001124900 gene=TsM_001124900
MANQLQLYKKTYPWHIDLLFCLVYLYKQAFAIPGSFFMNLLAGALYGTTKGLAITCAMTSIGATACYVLRLLPYNLITVQAGTLLSQIDPEKSIKENALLLSGVAIIMIIIGILVPKVRKYVISRSKEKPH